MLGIELQATATLTPEFYGRALAFTNLCLMGSVDMTGMKAFFHRFGLATEKSPVTVDRGDRKHSIYMNDQVLNWFIGTGDMTSQPATGQTQISLDVKPRLLDIATVEDSVDPSDKANDEDNGNEKGSACSSRYDLMSDETLSHIKKSRNVITATGRTNTIEALTIYDSTAKIMCFRGVQRLQRELFALVRERHPPLGSRKKIVILHLLEDYEWVTVINSDLQLQLVMPSSASLILISRWSGIVSSQILQDAHELHARFKNAFTGGQFGFEWNDRSIFDAYLIGRSAKESLEIGNSTRGATRGAFFRFIKKIESLPPRTELILYLLGIDGLCVDLESWKEFSAKFE